MLKTAAASAASPSCAAVSPKRGVKSGFLLRTRSAPIASTMRVSANGKKNVVVGLGSCGLDYLALVASFPKPDDKLRTEKMEMRGGGNCANALTAAARLGSSSPYLVSRVGSDGAAASIADELEADGVSTLFLSRYSGGGSGAVPSPTTYIIVDRAGGTRTCIHTPGPSFGASDLDEMMRRTTATAAATTTTEFRSLSDALDSASLVFFDGRLAEAALPLAEAALERGVPILVEAERPREGLDELLRRATFVTTSAAFPALALAGEPGTISSSSPSIPPDPSAPEPHPGAAAAWLLASLPETVRWVSTTLGERGAILLERSGEGGGEGEDAALVVERALRLAEEAREGKRATTAATSSAGGDVGVPGVASLVGKVVVLPGSGSISVNVHASTSARLPGPVVDSTGAGDAFNGALIHALSSSETDDGATGGAGGGKPPLSRALALACVVAGCNCLGLGARGGLPRSGEDVRWEALM